MISDYFKIAFSNLRRRGLRSWLTMLGIFISIATIFVLISLSLGLQEAVNEQFRQLGTDKLFVQPTTGFLGPPGSVGGTILTEDDVDFLIKERGIKDYSYFTAGYAKVDFKGETRYMLIWGIPADKMDVFLESGSFGIDEGRLLKKGDMNGVNLGQHFKQGKVFGKEVDVGNKITINDKDFKTEGVWELVGNPDDDRSVMMSIEAFRELFDEPERVDFIMLQVEEGEDINEVADRVEKKLRNFRDVTKDTQDFQILTPEDLLEAFGNILIIITVFLGGIAAISLVVGGIGIANTMYTSVIERTKEIGTMKAVGAQNKDILIIFLVESGLLGVVGATIGVLIGFGISKGVEWYAVNVLGTLLLQAAAPFYLVAGCLAFGFVVGAVSGVMPAWQASRTNVVDALRYE